MSYKPSLKATINARKVSLNDTLFILATEFKRHEGAVTAAVLLYLWIFFGLRNKHIMLRLLLFYDKKKCYSDYVLLFGQWLTMSWRERQWANC
jgi:hypothetical protein